MDNYLDHIIPIIKTKSGCDFHRLHLPLTYMGMDINKFSGKSLGNVLNEGDILIFNRTPGIPIENLLELKKIKKFFIIQDLDDHWELYTNHTLYQSWYASKANIAIQECAKYADAVIVTTSLLADKVRPLNKNVHVIQNALPYDQDQFTSEKEPSEFTRFLYAGGSTHFRDIQCLKMPFTKTLNNQKFNKSQFILAGVDQRNIESEVFWNKMENSFSLNKKLKGYSSRGTLPLDCYINHYNYSDVVLIPLEYNSFNTFKSNLKILEGAVKYNPCIASDTSPYSDFPDRSLIMYGSNCATWFDHLKKCASDPVFVKEKGQALGEYCRENFNLMKVNEYRKQLFEHLMK